MTQPYTIDVVKGRNYYMNLPKSCFINLNYLYKNYEYSFGLMNIGYGLGCAAGQCVVNKTINLNDQPYYYGAFTEAEGIYYWDMYRINSRSYVEPCGGA
jgi:hypothetical protein